MKLNILKTTAFASLVMLSGTLLPVSAAESLHVNVPFSFMVGNAKMAAGDYRISESDNGMVMLSGAKTSAMVLTVPTDYTKKNTTGLSFSSSDSNPVLTGIQVSGTVSREIPVHNGADRKVVLASAR